MTKKMLLQFHDEQWRILADPARPLFARFHASTLAFAYAQALGDPQRMFNANAAHGDLATRLVKLAPQIMLPEPAAQGKAQP